MNDANPVPGKCCPRCNGDLSFGYGLAFGAEPAGYEMCLDCDWYDKPGSTLDEPGEVTCLHQRLARLRAALQPFAQEGYRVRGLDHPTLRNLVRECDHARAVLADIDEKNQTEVVPILKSST